MLKDIIRGLTPYGIVQARRVSRMEQYHAQRKDRLRSFDTLVAGTEARGTKAFDFEDAVAFLISRGLDERHVREGSIPGKSLAFICGAMDEMLDLKQRIVGLHVGNFVGMSLCGLASYAKERNANSFFFAIDPNLTHRGIVSPHQWVCRLAERYGLIANILPICGFSNARNMRDDGVVFTQDSSEQLLDSDVGFENALTLLGSQLPAKLDIVLLDGNHEADYLREEIQLVSGLVKSGGLLILDDVDESWAELRELYRSFDKSLWTDVGTDGRVGILRKKN